MSTQSSIMSFAPRAGPAREESPSNDLQHMVGRMVSILRHRRWLFVLPLLTGTLAALLFSLTLPRYYYLNTLFERRDDVVITKLVTENSPYSFATLRQSLGINLAGYNAIAEAVEELGLTRDFPRDANGELTPEGRARKQNLVVGLSGQVSIALLEKSNFLDLIEVRYHGEDPDLGVQLVSRLRENYVARTRLWISDILEKSRQFFSQEAGNRKQRVARMQAELLDTTIQHPGVDPSDPDLLHEKLLSESRVLDDLQRRRAETLSLVSAREEYLAELHGHPAGMPTTRPALLHLPPNPVRQRLEQEIESLRTEIADARILRKMTEQHPHVVGLSEKLNQLITKMEAEPVTLAAPMSPTGQAAPARDPYDAERRRVQMELKSLQDVLAQIDRDIPRHEAERARLEEEKASLFERRQSFMMRQQELQTLKNDLGVWESHLETISRVLTAEAEDRGIRFATVEEARRPGRPASPTLSGTFLLSGGVGLALAVLTVFLREIFDRSIRNPARVQQALGVPVLEAIGEIRVGRTPLVLSRTRLAAILALIESAAVTAAGALVYLSLQKPPIYAEWVAQVRSFTDWF
jgi:uncharacterized protein involved in exopolysaccharide biosynthesis